MMIPLLSVVEAAFLTAHWTPRLGVRDLRGTVAHLVESDGLGSTQSLLPVQDYILIRRDENMEMSRGGVLLPKEMQKYKSPVTGTVIATPAAAGTSTADCIAPQDRVLITAYGDRLGRKVWTERRTRTLFDT
mmetsp:Transcript_8674/g.24804  ORF Transcript_8674/g.24804 Transcript_8674/m.24804 type:complete len:132 (+) Transcript_8674:1050-1445(+)